MDWSKLDTGLAAALAEGGGPARHFVVFVHLDPHADQVLGDVLLEAGAGRDVRTGELTAEQVEVLSHRSDVRMIRLSRTLLPMNDH